MATSFDEFWPEYLRAHADPQTRVFHYLGTAVAAASLLAAVSSGKSRWLLDGLPGAYALSWLGHARHGAEPASFSAPIWSLFASIRMFRYWLTGRLDAELEQAGVAPALRYRDWGYRDRA